MYNINSVNNFVYGIKGSIWISLIIDKIYIQSVSIKFIHPIHKSEDIIILIKKRKNWSKII